MNMSRISVRVCGLAMSILISACAYPTSGVVQGGPETALYFSHSPANAHVFIDGVDAGLVEVFDGKEAVLVVTPGRHIVELRIGTSQIFQKEVYLGDGTVQKIDVNQVEMK